MVLIHSTPIVVKIIVRLLKITSPLYGRKFAEQNNKIDNALYDNNVIVMCIVKICPAKILICLCFSRIFAPSRTAYSDIPSAANSKK